MDNVSLKAENLNEKAYYHLKQAIIQNKLAPGTRIVDSQIADMFGISRTPARDAIKMLIREGLIVNKGARGTYVLDVSEKDINELYDIRLLIEKGAIDLISKKVDTFPLNESENILKSFNEQSKKPGEEFMRVDDEFHEMLVRFCKNDRLIKIHKDISNQTKIFKQIQSMNKKETDYAMNTHSKILFAVRDGDFKLAAELLEKHIELARSQALKLFKSDS